MHIGRIAGATRVLNAPEGWDNKKVFCGSLPIKDGKMANQKTMTSAWFPTPEEIQNMADGAPIYLVIIGETHPVVALGVGEPPDHTMVLKRAPVPVKG